MKSEIETLKNLLAEEKQKNTPLKKRLALVEGIARRLAEHVLAIGSNDGGELQAYLLRRGMWDAHAVAVAVADIIEELPPSPSEAPSGSDKALLCNPEKAP